MAGETATPEAAIEGAAIISIYLKDAPAVRGIFARIEAALKPGQIVLNHATVDLETTIWLDEICGARGCQFLDTPFTGSKIASATGQLLYYTGGDSGLAQELKSYLSVTSRGQLHCGSIGTATVVKMAAGDYETHFSLANMGKDSRYMLALAESAGLDTPAIAAVSRRMEKLSAEGLGDLDFSAVAKPYLQPG